MGEGGDRPDNGELYTIVKKGAGIAHINITNERNSKKPNPLDMSIHKMGYLLIVEVWELFAAVMVWCLWSRLSKNNWRISSTKNNVIHEAGDVIAFASFIIEKIR